MVYAIKIAKMFYGLHMTDFRKLAYTYAVACESESVPENWENEQCASRDWYYAFMNRHPRLTLKAPEGMSIARAIAFNKVSVNAFFNAYTSAMEKYAFTADRIYNLDESSLSTVMKPMKVVCEKGTPVASQISRERGTTMTFVGIINAAGHYIPPVFIIPRKRMNESFMRGTIDGSKGILHQNGWMNGECFLGTIQHIQEKTFCSPTNKILLLMDNAECHMSIRAIEYAINNGIVIVTLPPHRTDKLQPLDVSVFGPFKSCLKAIIHDYTLMHPHTHITEHLLPEFASKAWVKACTPSNVLSGFAATGIWPINSNIFPEEAFLGAQVSERAAPPSMQEEAGDIVSTDEGVESATSSSLALSVDVQARPVIPSPLPSPVPSTSTSVPAHLSSPVPSSAITPGPSSAATPGPSSATTPGPSSATTPSPSSGTSPGPSAHLDVTPEGICPFPKAPERPAGKGRKKVRACILTEDEESLSNLRAKEERKRKKDEKQGETKRRQKEQRVPIVPDNSDEEEELVMHLDDSSEYSDEVEEEDVTAPTPFQQKEPEEGDFILVELELEEGRNVGAKVHYVGKVLSVDDSGEYNVSFLRMSGKFGLNDTFYFPIIQDEMEVKKEQILGVLFEPSRGRTQRLSSILKFDIPLLSYNIR